MAVCGGFTCSKTALTILNLLYIVIGFVLIGVGAYGKASSIVTDLPIVGGLPVCGVLLMLISLLGLAGAIRHHQVMLFFYMVILFLLFLVQFSIATACLAVNAEQQETLAQQGWARVDDDIKTKVQQTFNCCGFNNHTNLDSKMGHPSCDTINNICCNGNIQENCKCSPCIEKLQATINYAFKLCGSIGLFFSFTEFVGVWLTIRYRNQKDPRANSSAFL